MVGSVWLSNNLNLLQDHEILTITQQVHVMHTRIHVCALHVHVSYCSISFEHVVKLCVVYCRKLQPLNILVLITARKPACSFCVHTDERGLVCLILVHTGTIMYSSLCCSFGEHLLANPALLALKPF